MIGRGEDPGLDGERRRKPRDGSRRGLRSALPVVRLAPWSSTVESAVTRHRHKPGPLLLILQDIQAELRHIPPDAVQMIADAVNLSRAEVHGVISFYHDLREQPSGRHMLKVCRAESCQAVGADALLAHAKRRLAIDLHQTTPDGQVTLEPVYCLGNCALSPAVIIDDTVYGRVTTEKLDELIEFVCDVPPAPAGAGQNGARQ